jgi:hypothetical protein
MTRGKFRHAQKAKLTVIGTLGCSMCDSFSIVTTGVVDGVIGKGFREQSETS